MPEKCSDAACPLLPRVEALEEENRHNKEAHKVFYEKLEGSHTSVALIEERMSQIKEDTEEIKETVQELKDKPGKRWETLVGCLLSALAGAFLYWLAAGMPGVGG